MDFSVTLLCLLFSLFQTIRAEAGTEADCPPVPSAPWETLGSSSFDESELPGLKTNSGLYRKATWPMPKDFFRTDWDPALAQFQNSKLSLSVEKRSDGRLMGAEIRTTKHYGYGCLSACMKPIKESGIISSLFMYTGFWDGYLGIQAKHNEIDIEFEGKDTNVVQFNYFTNNTDTNQSNEYDHELDFDASTSFNVFGFRWTPAGIEWEVNGEIVRCVGRDAVVKPPIATSDGLQKVMANTWVVAEELEDLFGGKFDTGSFTKKTAEYQWIRYEKLNSFGSCDIAVSC